MKATLLKTWDAMRSSYWFIPSIMAVGAIALSFATTAVDAIVGSAWVDEVGWLYANKPDGARALLSTIAGSMIGVAGVTFSITIAAVSYATSQFGPRLLTNFMRDQGNQITLGTFIATFLYCLLVLRTIRSPDEAPSGSTAAIDAVAGFVPHIAILCALIFALASIGVLIFFIHHIPESIHASNVVADVGRDLNRQIDTIFPQQIGYGVPEDREDVQEDLPEHFLEEAIAIRAGGDGYVQYVNEKGLLSTATDHDLLLRIEYRPGDFVTERKALVLAWPGDSLDDGIEQKIRGAFAWGRQRTQGQDVLFLANELVEIASRALSPGTNDPFTAMTCMDWLSSALINLARRDIPDAYRYDEHRRLRVIAHPVSFEEFAEAVFPPMRPYVEADRNAAIRLMEVMGEVAQECEQDERRAVILHHATDLKDGTDRALPHASDRDEVDHRFRIVARLLRDPDSHRMLSDKHHWLGGSG